MGSIKRRTGGIKKKKAVALGLFCLKYFAFLFLGIVAVVLGALFAFEILVLNDAIYPANYAEKQAKAAAEQIAGVQEVGPELIPDLCQYVLFDADGKGKGGDIEEEGLDNAWKAVLGQTSDAKGYYYSVIRRSTEYCVLRYTIMPQYKSPILRRHLPGPQNLLFAAGLSLILLLVVVTAFCFGHTLRKKLVPLILTAEKIRNQDLEFNILTSDVKEIAAVLQAMGDMRDALKTALESQWKLEQRKKEQLLALAHDLKTPLTLIRGNAELLCDTELTEEQKECTGFIESGALRMQNYVQALIEITRDGYAPRLQKTDIDSFLQEIGAQFRRLCVMKKISLQERRECGNISFIADRELLMRALMNIAVNAVEYTPEGGTILWEAETAQAGAAQTVETRAEGMLLFSVSDSGKGFSPEALQYAAEQFYMEDSGRHSKSHHGIGLFMADLAAKQHGGELLLENSQEMGGARVVMKIPCEIREVEK